MDTINFSGWTAATGNLPAGVQGALRDTLMLVESGDVRLSWGTDFQDGVPCLINAVCNMLDENVTNVSPSKRFPELVSAFDEANGNMESYGINTAFYTVDPLAATFLLRNFGEPATVAYVERTDEEMGEALSRMLTGPNPVTCNEPAVGHKVDAFKYMYGSVPQKS